MGTCFPCLDDCYSLSEFAPDSSVYSDYKWPVHFSLKQVPLPFIGYDKYSRSLLYEVE